MSCVIFKGSFRLDDCATETIAYNASHLASNFDLSVSPGLIVMLEDAAIIPDGPLLNLEDAMTLTGSGL